MGESTQRKYVHTLRIAIFAFVLSACPSVFALNPELDINQYAHTSWKNRDGFTNSAIHSITQTPDGYIWLGSASGLLRFDGVKPLLWQPPDDQQLPSINIMKLLTGRDGTLWIGTDKGLASWKDRKLTQYPELAGYFIFALLEDRDDTLWVGASTIPNGNLFSIRDGRVQSYGDDGTFERGVFSLYEDRKGNLWVGGRLGLWRWKPGPPKFFVVTSGQDTIRGLGEDDDGALLISKFSGILRFIDGKTEAYTLPETVRQSKPVKLLRDRDGGLWIVLLRGGLTHKHRGKIDVYSSSDGLSSDNVESIFEDREGSIWVVTSNGIDRFRDLAVPTITAKQGLSDFLVWSVLAAKDGSVLLTNSRELDRWSNGQVTTNGRKAAPAEPTLNAPNSLFQDDRGRIWVGTPREFGYMENDRFVSLPAVPGGVVRSMAEDDKRNLWIANQNAGLFCLREGKVIQQIPWTGLGRKDFAAALAVDRTRGGLWLGFFKGGLAYFSDGKVQVWYGADDGLGAGRVNDFRFDPDGTLWIATESGLSRFKNGRFATLKISDGLPCGTIHWLQEDDDRALWMATACGVVRVDRLQLDKWTAAVDQGLEVQKIQGTVFDISDGVLSAAFPVGYYPMVAKTADGKLWFPNLDGVSVIDPRHLAFNLLPPPVHIEQFVADHQTYIANEQLQLPPLIRDLRIDYTALSLAAPEKVFFRYKLEPWDREWQDVGNRRQAFYNNLPPGSYRFRVMACNNSGVWNEEGALLDFSIAHAYYQATWFRLSCAAAFLLLLVAIYRLRVRQVARQFNMRIEERVNERTRIARDLHDTLLQSFQGLLLKFQAVTYLYPERAVEARMKLESVIDQAEQAISEGRDAVQGLRSSTVVGTDLAEAISALGKELTADGSNKQPQDFSVGEEGATRELAPLLRDEVYRISGEALRNAFKHAHAKRIEVEIHYDRQKFQLRIRDNGKGIDPKVVAKGGLDRHYGLAGMRERAELVGGKLDIWSEIDSGTEVELTIPASIAYAKSTAGRRSMAFWRRT